MKVPKTKVRMTNYPFLCDTGASVCIAGFHFLSEIGLCKDDLLPTTMRISSADSSNIEVSGIVFIKLENKETDIEIKEMFYTCEGTTGALLSLESCQHLQIISPSFPNTFFPSNHWVKAAEKTKGCCNCPARALPPPLLDKPPFDPVEENVDKLKNWIMENYKASVFNTCECQPLPVMHGPPLKIFMQEGVTPVATHLSLYLFTGKLMLRKVWIGM